MELKIYAKVPQFKFDRGPLKDAINAELADAAKTYEQTYSTWGPDHRPNIVQTRARGNQNMEQGTIGYDGDAQQNKIYKYIDEGTEVRRAHMTDDFIPKTTPNQVQAGPGRGGLAWVDPEWDGPGIEARNFTKRIAKLHRDRFRRRLKRIRASGVIRKSGIRVIG